MQLFISTLFELILNKKKKDQIYPNLTLSKIV